MNGPWGSKLWGSYSGKQNFTKLSDLWVLGQAAFSLGHTVILSVEGMLSCRAIHPIFNVGITRFLFCWFCCTPSAFWRSTNKNEIGHIPNAPPPATSSSPYCYKLVGGVAYYWIALEGLSFISLSHFPI